jgi:hypothetical protein
MQAAGSASEMIAASSRVRSDEAVDDRDATHALDGEPGGRESRANWQSDENAIARPDADLPERVGNLAHAVGQIRVSEPATDRDDRRLASFCWQVTIEQLDREVRVRGVAELWQIVPTIRPELSRRQCAGFVDPPRHAEL